MTRAFAAAGREEDLAQMAAEELDLLVIGGGATGAGIALDAALRELRVGLVDKGDFAGGTSSRSTKLIHGGLRYLKQGEIQLVREVGRERTILFHNAPHIVRPERMLLPIVHGGTYGRLATSAGLYVYDVLAGVQRPERRRMLSKAEALRAEPLLRSDILRGGGLYYEYRTDDARLTTDIVKSAVRAGARCVNFAKVERFRYQEGRIAGAHVLDVRSQRTYSISAKRVVNATGPWVDHLRNLDGSLSGKRLQLTKGTHIVVPGLRLPLHQSVYFDVEDGRMVFAIPRDGWTYIGTTDTNYTEEPETVRASAQDVEYLLSAANAMFPSVHLTSGDVVSSWAGLRPLIHEEGKSPSELSRRDEVFVSDQGLLSIAGGKLTGYRKMAERVVDRVAAELSVQENRTFGPCVTEHHVLVGGELDGQTPQVYTRALVTSFREWAPFEDRVLRLVRRYGSQTSCILESASRLLAARSSEGSHELDSFEEKGPLRSLLEAEVHYGVNCERVTSAADFLIRRTGRLYFGQDEWAREMLLVLEMLAGELDWSADQLAQEREEMDEARGIAVNFR